MCDSCSNNLPFIGGKFQVANLTSVSHRDPSNDALTVCSVHVLFENGFVTPVDEGILFTASIIVAYLEEYTYTTESYWNNFEMAPKWHGEKETHKRVEVSHVYSISLP